MVYTYIQLKGFRLMLGYINYTTTIYMCGGVVREHSVKTPNADYCFFHMEILYVDIYKFVTCSMNIL